MYEGIPLGGFTKALRSVYDDKAGLKINKLVVASQANKIIEREAPPPPAAAATGAGPTLPWAAVARPSPRVGAASGARRRTCGKQPKIVLSRERRSVSGVSRSGPVATP
ncbi:hypothetical protein EVAR_67611_1 [Eumeta japonica]|uniref:Uncharacterized protein n=1 Tax=Eumeta variegata TaxID=151549 RepID=A0A4C2A5J9_EUMVA|nr:hypothetical protein EVAR_67611_1 [Eumeta japonica]